MVKLGLVGFPVAHSKSPEIFNGFFEEHGIQGQYDLIELATNAELEQFFTHDIFEYQGLNVTIPYKSSLIERMDEISPEVKEIEALNTIVIRENKLHGYNTDMYGFMKTMMPLSMTTKRALVFGTGGSSKAVHYVLNALEIPHTFVSRNPTETQCGYEDINAAVLSEYNLLINTTPLGMSPMTKSAVNIDYKSITSRHTCIDLVYNPIKTKFLKQCEEQGATIINGEEMLHEQAFFSYNLFTQ